MFRRCSKHGELRHHLDPNLQSNDDEGVSLLSGTTAPCNSGGVIIFLFAFIVVAQVARAAGKRKAIAAKQEDQLAQASVAEEEERRQAWIQHYIAQGNHAEALGWKAQRGCLNEQFEMQQQAAEDAAIPTMFDLENL